MRRTTMHHPKLLLASASAALLLTGCVGSAPDGLADSAPALTTVAFDWYSKPLPTIPLPNDVATRFDATSPTKRRLNASLIADSTMERRTRKLFDELDGWGTYSPISIPFTGPLDVDSVRTRHCAFEEGDDLHTFCAFENDRSDDAIYVVNIDPSSEGFGDVIDLDVGAGAYPVVLEDINGYYENDPRGWTNTILFDEAGEDTNGNGLLDPGEDTDLDGVLDQPNYLPGHHPARSDLRGRADAVMSFYETETNTLIVRPMMPLRERTTYAVIVTRRVLDANGMPVGSPFPWVNDASQTDALTPLLGVLPAGLDKTDIAFTFSFTTGTMEGDWIAVRDGLYGHGVQAHLATEFPAEVDSLFALRPDEKQRYILYTEEWLEALQLINSAFFGGDPNKVETQALIQSESYIDYQVIGTYRSPQLFDRYDADGNFLPLDAQSWPNDVATKPAKARSEDVYFWLTIPRKEVSARKDGQPVPIVILGHGYGSQRFEMLQFSGFFAEYGIATLAIDCVSHGIGLNESEKTQASTLLAGLGLGPVIDAILTDRSFDQNADGVKDSGADFWTSYLFHTRDVVRQSGLDYMQLLRIIDTWDGTKRWDLDTNGDGQPDLAGDFDGDGQVDIGKGSTVAMTGGSLGGIMSTVVGGAEPKVDAIAPISGGGGLGDIGMRSLQGGVREAVILRIMGPLYTGTLDADSGTLAIGTVIPDLNDDAHIQIGSIADAQIGDTLVGRNLVNGVVGCGLVAADGRARLSLASDLGDETVVELYRGDAVVLGSEACELRADAELVGTLDRFGVDITFQGDAYAEGGTLVALAEGMGRPRTRPGLRRLLQLGQIALDRADPAVHAAWMQRRPLTYPGTGETTATHALFVTTMGDMNVPASSGLNMARAAGLIEYHEVDERWGKTPHQVLVDTGAYEAVDKISRYTDPNGTPVHIDLENFSGGDDIWGAAVPRLDPPMRLTSADALGGISGSIVPFPRPSGQHGFAFPGEELDRARRDCKAACTETEGSDPCGCKALELYDVGSYMFHLLGQYMATGGKALDFDRCKVGLACDGVPAPPAERNLNDLRK
ncbi:MAG: hypothetical protein EP329_22890 [Deltaproteobacteria bacterium]|nr:MAG: hypothetical protein EP329_22890 [Deltaproteobacteria bacterium]